MARAVETEHSKDLERHTSEISQNAVKANFASPPFKVTKLSVEVVERWTVRAKKLDPVKKEANKTV